MSPPLPPSPSLSPQVKVVLRCVSSDGNQYVQVVRSPVGLRVEFGQRDRTNHELISTFLIYCLLRSDKKLQGEEGEGGVWDYQDGEQLHEPEAHPGGRVYWSSAVLLEGKIYRYVCCYVWG